MVSIDVEDRGSLKVIRIKGEFFLGYVRQVEEVWSRVAESSPDIIAIDCREMTFVDSSAIGTFVKFLNNSISRDIKLLFFDMNESIDRIFTKAKLNKIFSIISREEFERIYLNG